MKPDRWMRCSVGILALAALPGCSGASAEAFVARAAVPIDSVDVRSDDYSDLAAIGRAIGEARVVMLGEQDHGDAATFRAKTRLIKYLHEIKGFDVLAFESDFFALTQGWDAQPGIPAGIARFNRDNVFSIWSHCDGAQYLFNEYIPNTVETATPLTVTGFDSQVVLEYSRRRLAESLDSVLTRAGVPATRSLAWRTFVRDDLPNLLTQYEKRNEGRAFYARLDSLLSDVYAQLSAGVSREDYWLLVIENLVHHTRSLAAETMQASNAERDDQMARNLDWLLTYRFKDEKVIVWAHNSHILKNSDRLSYAVHSFTNMTTHMLRHRWAGDDVYVLGFTSGKGTAGRLGMERYPVMWGERNSVDGVLLRLGYANAFVDFRQFNHDFPGNAEPFLMKGTSHSYGRERWNEHYDGVFYIRDMYPCNAVGW